MQKLTREWLRKSESDRRVAELLAQSNPMPTDQVCFHCQQAVEKLLKALLQEHGSPVPKSHDLEHLYNQAAPFHARLSLSAARLNRLTQYAVDYRYPGSHARVGQARSALRYVELVRVAVRTSLGLRVRPGKRKKK